MIKTIKLAGVASYGSDPETLAELEELNFFYGANGSGKTTISRVIASPEKYSTCLVEWEQGNERRPVVYNRDFISENFDQSIQLRGVFTLGSEHKVTLESIRSEKEAVDGVQTKIRGLKNTLEGEGGVGGKKGELAELEAEFSATCWAQKQKHDGKLSARAPRKLIRLSVVDFLTFGCGPWDHDLMAPSGPSVPQRHSSIPHLSGG